MVKSTCHSPRGPDFESYHPCLASHSNLSFRLQGLWYLPSSGHCDPGDIYGLQIDADIYMNKNNSKKKLSYLSINGPGDSVGWEKSEAGFEHTLSHMK